MFHFQLMKRQIRLCKVHLQHQLELDHLSLLFLITTKFEVLASLKGLLGAIFAFNAFETNDNLLCRLGFLVENWLGLSTETGLLSVITALTLGIKRGFTSLVLGNLVQGVLFALLACTEGLSGLRDVDHL